MLAADKGAMISLRAAAISSLAASAFLHAYTHLLDVFGIACEAKRTDRCRVS